MTHQQALEFYARSHSKAIRTIRKLRQWDEDATAQDNALRCGFQSLHAMYVFARRHGLRFRSRRKNFVKGVGVSQAARRRDVAIVLLRRAGMSWQEIGLLFGTTRQAVEQRRGRGERWLARLNGQRRSR